MQTIDADILSVGLREDHPFPAALVICTGSSNAETLVIAKNCLNPTALNGRVLLQGNYLQSTLRGLRVFECEALAEVDNQKEVAKTNTGKRGLCISGQVKFVSQCFKLKFGTTAFVTMSLHEFNEDIKFLVMGSAIRILPFICAGCNVELCNPKRFRWKEAGDTSATDATLPSTAGPVLHSSESIYDHYYFVQRLEQVNVTMPPHNPSTSSNNNNTSSSSNNSDDHLSAEELVTPLTLLDKEILTSTEFGCVVGTVNAVHPLGWLELREARIHRRCCCGQHNDAVYADTSARDGDDSSVYGSSGGGIALPSCVVYLSHYLVQHLRLSALGVSVRQGAVVCLQRVLPSYLWGRMKGLATTCRSNIRIVRFAESKQFVSRDPTHCAVSVKVPAEVRQSCVLYAAWRVEISRRLAQAVGGSLLRRNEGLEQSITVAVEDLARLSVAPEKVGGEAVSPLEKEQISAGAVEGDRVATQSLREAVALAPISVQSELFDLNSVLLYTMRSGLDADWLGNSLPQLHTASHFVAKLQSLHQQQQAWTCDKQLFSLAHYDVSDVPRGGSYWSQYSRGGGGSSSSSSSGGKTRGRDSRKNVALIGIVRRAVISNSAGTINGIFDESLTLRIEDAQGCSVRLVIQQVSAAFKEKLRVACAAALCLKPHQGAVECVLCGGWRHLQSSCSSSGSCSGGGMGCGKGSNEMSQAAAAILSEYRSLCTCGSRSNAGSCGAEEAVVLLLHRPTGLVEYVPAQATTPVPGELISEASRRFYACCAADDVTIISTAGPDTSPPARSSSIRSNSSSSSSAFQSGKKEGGDTTIPAAIGIRQLLAADLKGCTQKVIPCLIAVVTQIQVLSNDSKSEDSSQWAGPDSKRVKLEAHPAGSAGVRAQEAEQKCSLVLRDAHFPDAMYMYVSLPGLRDVTVGSVVQLRSLYACLPMDQKKMYVRPVDPKKPQIDVVGMVSGSQLRRLSQLSVAQPDPRFVDVSSIRWHDRGAGRERINSPGGGRAACAAGYADEEPFLHAPPVTTFRHLTQASAYMRAQWRVQCQVVFVRKITVTLRCTQCRTVARVVPPHMVFRCDRCLSTHTLSPLWEANVALDDGTAETTAHIEGDSVFPFLRARYDDKGLMLQDICALVDDYVLQFGSLTYDAFDQSGSVEYNKPYHIVVGEQQQAQQQLLAQGKRAAGDISDKSSVTSSSTDAAPVSMFIERPGSNAVFDMPLSDIEKRLVLRFPLHRRPASVKVGTLLRAYMQVGSCAHQYAILCRVDFSAVALKQQHLLQGTAKAGSGIRELKVQRNNAEKPYLAYFSLRPTRCDAKLSVQVLHAQEVHGGALTGAAWDLLQAIQTRAPPPVK